MTCQEFWKTIPRSGAREFADSAAVAGHEHLAQCRGCADRLENDRTLQQGLRAMAEQMSRTEAPAQVELRLRAAFRAQSGMGDGAWRATVAHRPWLPVLTWAAAAAVLFALALFLMRSRQPELRPAVARGAEMAIAGVPAEIEVATDVAENDFIPLPNAVQIEPNEDVNLVRVEVPRSAMIALGFYVKPEEASQRVQADVMLGSDGLARAVRFID